MKDSYQQLALRNNTTEQRFELDVENETAFLAYKKEKNKYILVHTEVPEALEGMGIAAALVEKVFIYMRENKFKIIPLCPYVVAYLRKHSDWVILTN